jgi:hypothetical protein
MTVFIGVVCVLLIGTDLWRSVAARRAQIDEMTTATSNLARAMAQHANDAFKEADTTLIGMVERVEEDGTSPADLARLHRSLVSRVQQLPQLNGLFIFDKDGAWIVNSQAKLDSRFNNSDREYFEYHRTHTDQGSHIGPPVKSRSTGKWIVPVSRRIDAPDGSFAGVALATIDIDFFSRFYDSLDLGQSGAAVLVLNSGTMIVRRPFEDRFVGKNVSDTALYRSHLEGRSGVFTTKSSQDHVTRLNSLRELQDYPLFVAAALSEDEILGPWWRDTLWHASVRPCSRSSSRCSAHGSCVRSRRAPTSSRRSLAASRRLKPSSTPRSARSSPWTSAARSAPSIRPAKRYSATRRAKSSGKTSGCWCRRLIWIRITNT